MNERNCADSRFHRIFFNQTSAFIFLITLGFVGLARHAFAQTEKPLPHLSVLKKMSVEELMNIEVTSVSKRPEKLSETASAIQVVTGDDIRRSSVSSLPEALRLAGNLNVAQKGSHAWGISARGFNTELANKLLVLIDGRTVYTPLFSGVFWERQDYLLEDIDRIEVISGPGGTLWGANAVNGVINIISKNAKVTNGLYLEAGAGTELDDFAGARYGGAIGDNTYYRIYGNYFNRGSAAFANGNSASDSWRKGKAGFRIDAETSAKDKLTLQGDFFGSDERLSTGGRARVRGGNILGRWSRAFSDDSEMSLQFYYDRTHLHLPTVALIINSIEFAPAGTFEEDLDTYDLDFQHRFQLGGRNKLVWGLGYRYSHDVLSNSPALAFFPAVQDRKRFSGFVQDEAMLIENLFFTLGSKFEHNDYTGWEIAPSARLQWNLDENQTLWAAVSRAVRTPSRIDRDLSQPAPPFLVVLAGGKDFVSETVIAYELGYRAQLGERAAASIAAFYNDYDDVRSTSLTPTVILPFFFENNLEGETYGFELSATYHAFNWWRWRAGYNLLKEDIRIKPGEMDFNNALNETADPQQQLSLHASLDLLESLEMDTGLRWVDRLRINNAGIAETVPSYFELDARASWRFTKKFAFSIVGQNLLHKHHPEYGIPGPTRPEIERSLYGKISCRF